MRERRYDGRGNVIYEKNDHYEHWYKYDENNNQIYWRRSDGHERWIEYDENNREIHGRVKSGYEWWYEYDVDGNKRSIPEEIIRGREPVSRFALMEIE